MNENIERNAWSSFIDEFSKRNTSRPTWLQVLGEAGAQSEEEGLPLAGISFEEKNVDAPRVQIMLGGKDGKAVLHLTHVISDVARVMPQVGSDGRDEAIEFVDKNGEASLLIFNHRARMGIGLQLSDGHYVVDEPNQLPQLIVQEAESENPVIEQKYFVASFSAPCFM